MAQFIFFFPPLANPEWEKGTRYDAREDTHPPAFHGWKSPWGPEGRAMCSPCSPCSSGPTSGPRRGSGDGLLLANSLQAPGWRSAWRQVTDIQNVGPRAERDTRSPGRTHAREQRVSEGEPVRVCRALFISSGRRSMAAPRRTGCAGGQSLSGARERETKHSMEKDISSRCR